MDILPRFLEASGRYRLKRYLSRFVSLVTGFIIAWFALSSWRFVQVEMEYGREVFWGISSGYLVAIIPCGLALICYRFFFVFVDSFSWRNGDVK